MYSNFLRASAARSPATVLRAFSDAAHKPVVDLHGLPARYANATYVAASKAGVLPKVETELLALQETAKTNESFGQFLENPLISREAKTTQIEAMLKGKFSPTTVNLMTTLAGNARLTELDKVASCFSELMKAKRGEVEATIISAAPLSKAQTDAIAKAMKSQVGEGKQVMLNTSVDPSILGGLQVQIGDKFLDLSVSSRIEAISRIPV